MRRGRKFKGRPGSHDGLSVIAAYGNRAGYDRSGRVVGRVGHHVVETRDGTRLSVLAGAGTLALPQPQLTVMCWFRDLTPWQRLPDYRGPYWVLDVLLVGPVSPAVARSRWLLPQDLGPYTVRLWRLRKAIEAGGGFRRMVRTSPAVMGQLRRGAVWTAENFAQMAVSHLRRISDWMQAPETG